MNTGLFADFSTDLSQYTVSPDELLSGGPGKDGIPAISNPKFTSIDEARVADDVQGLFLQSDDGGRFYPYTILVWHEIVNDEIDGQPVAVTFCPLCGSGIAFSREFADGTTPEFGVSGFLRESNMVMYDRDTESLWQQSTGEAIIGQRTGQQLEVLDADLISLAELREFHPDAQVLSRDTGYTRTYGFYPYGNYENNDNFVFPVSEFSNTYPAKELMYVAALPGHAGTVAISRGRMITGRSYSIDTTSGVATLTRHPDGTITATLDDANIPGYFEMWFSWVINNEGDGHRVVVLGEDGEEV